MNTNRPLLSSRRRLLGQAGLVGIATLAWPAFAAGAISALQPPKGPLTFTAYRNGSRLGFHEVRFSEEDGRLIVDIEIAFDVKLAFIPVYRYRHTNREVWEDGKLLSMSSRTDDNGDPFEVEARQEDGRLIVDGTDGRLELPGDTPTTSYWNEAMMISGEWLDTQAGRLARSEVTEKPPETVQVEGGSVEATPYDLVGDITGMLWYADGRWVKLRFNGEDGSEIDYALEAPQQNG